MSNSPTTPFSLVPPTLAPQPAAILRIAHLNVPRPPQRRLRHWCRPCRSPNTVIRGLINNGILLLTRFLWALIWLEAEARPLYILLMLWWNLVCLQGALMVRSSLPVTFTTGQMLGCLAAFLYANAAAAIIVKMALQRHW